MKGYRQFLFGIIAVLLIYIVSEFNHPKPLDWTLTLSKEDKNPLGAFVLYQQLPYCFSGSVLDSYGLPVYDELKNKKAKNTAYFIFGHNLNLSSHDITALLNYAAEGNYVFIAARAFSEELMDTLNLKTSNRFGLAGIDSSFVNFTNPLLKSNKSFSYRSPYFEQYFTSLDTVRSIVLGRTNLNKVNFVKIPIGKGAFFMHSSPVCFSNYFLLKGNNAEYASKALSYIPTGVTSIFWDEYYKRPQYESISPFRFLYSNVYLRWGFRIALFTLILYVLFGSKRRQRIIPVMEPLRNSTLDFVNTIGKLYFNQHDNRDIAVKKINYFLEFVRTNFYLSTTQLNFSFQDALAKKTSLPREDINSLIWIIQEIDQSASISDIQLQDLNQKIDNFYKNAR